jgi:hypothetical protein
MPKTTKVSRKSAMPGNVTNKQVRKVENRKSYNKKVEGLFEKYGREKTIEGPGATPSVSKYPSYGYKKAMGVSQTDKGKSKVVKQSFKSEDLKNKKAVGKQNKKYSKTIYK